MRVRVRVRVLSARIPAAGAVAVVEAGAALVVVVAAFVSTDSRGGRFGLQTVLRRSCSRSCVSNVNSNGSSVHFAVLVFFTHTPVRLTFSLGFFSPKKRRPI